MTTVLPQDMDRAAALVALEEGDSLQSVKAKLGVVDPPVVDEQDPRKTAFYHFPEIGAWAFFTADGSLEARRFEAPFDGVVDDVRIGDSREQVLERKGKPDRLHPMDDKERFIYKRPRFLRVDFDPKTNRVDEIYL